MKGTDELREDSLCLGGPSISESDAGASTVILCRNIQKPAKTTLVLAGGSDTHKSLICRCGQDRSVARTRGWDYYALRSDWLTFAQAETATAKGNPPKNPGAAFVAYCGNQEDLR